MPHTVRNYSGPSDADSYWEYLAGEDALTLALFLKITPSTDFSGMPTLGFTSFDEPVTLSAHSMTFYPTAGLFPSAVETEASKPANFELTGVFEATGVTEADLLAGKWTGAGIELWRMNYSDLTMGEEVLFRGKISHFTNKQDGFKAEITGYTDRMDTNFGEMTSRVCRRVRTFTLFPGECGYDASTSGGFNNQRTLTANTITSRTLIKFTGQESVPSDFYTNGRAECLTGDNEGIAREIKSAEVVSGKLEATLKRAFPLAVAPGDTFKFTVGCNGTLERCIYFDNVINRSAEDFIPGVDTASRVPPTY